MELKEKVDYNKDLATNDAQEIVTLLEKTENLWSEKSNLSLKVSQMQHQQSGLFQIILVNYTLMQKNQL